MARVCAWCEAPIGLTADELFEDEQATSHGLCDDCVGELIETLEESPRRSPRHAA